MFGTDLSVQAVPYTGPPPPRPSQPEPQQRVVEGSGEADLRPRGGALQAPAPSRVEQLKHSARQFVQLLESTGSVVVASSISGLRVGQLDTYA